jgi:hypothetical protein
MRSRAFALVLTVVAIGGTTVGGIAIAGGGGNGGSAADAQYKPGMGCGDKNHIHTGPPGNPSKDPATDCKPGSAQNP